MIDSDRIHAALHSHTPTCPDQQHLLPQPLPTVRNFESASLKSERRESSSLLHGRLLATSDRDLQEHAAEIVQAAPAPALAPAPPAKQRAQPQPPLTLAIPHCTLAQAEWHIAARSAGLAEGGAATHIQSEHSGVGAGYFSPPRSPDASHAAPLPASPSSSKSTRSRSRSVTNGELAKLSDGKHRGAQKMVKERRSLQALLIPSFLHSLQAQTTPLGLVPGPRSAALPMPALGTASSANSNNISGAGSGADGNGNEGARSERRRSFYGRRRSQTYTVGNSSTSTSSLASSSTLVPPMPDTYPPQGACPAAPGGRESPSAYLLDDDPFAFTPAVISAPVNSPTYSPAYTPTDSPARSLTHSRSPSTVSLSSASSTSMPGTPVFQTFGALPEEREGISPALMASPTSAASMASITVPAPPPPTPASPLNPNPTPSGSSATETAKPRGRILRSLSATTSSCSSPPPTAAQPAASSLSPTHTSLGVSPLPHPPPVRARPAHTRPAFAPRPSLPSLTALSRMGAAAGSFASPFRGKKRRGKVGAGLPAEPWDLLAPASKPGYEEGLEMERQEREEEEEGGEEAEGDVEEREEDGEDGERMERGRVRAKTVGASSASGEPFYPPEHFSHSGIALESTRAQEVTLASSAGTQIDGERSPSPSPAAVLIELVDEAHVPSMLTSAEVRMNEGDAESSGLAYLSPEEPEVKDRDNNLERIDEGEGGNEKEDVAGDADGEGRVPIDAGLAYMNPSSLSDSAKDTDGENSVTTAVLARGTDVRPLSETHEEREDKRPEPNADPEVALLNGADSPLDHRRPEDDSNDGDRLDRLAPSEPSSSIANAPVRAVTIPGRASAIPRHVLRALTPYSFAAPRIASRLSSPASSNASLSPQSSIEDFGILLSTSPGFRGDQRPESLTIDPALPEASAHTHEYTQMLPSTKDHPYLKDDTPLSSSPSPLPPPLPSPISPERVDPEIEAEKDTETGADIDFGSTSDAVFGPENEVQVEGLASTYATSLDLLSFPPSSPILTRDPGGLEHPSSPTPICAFEPQAEYTSSSDELSPSPQREEDYADYYLNEYEHELGEEEDDSSMLPPLSTLPEDDPVFSLTPAGPRERYGVGENTTVPARPVSRKASVATIASIFSMKSGSSGRVSQGSHTYSRTHSPAASLSNSLPYSNSNSGSGSGSYAGRRTYGSSSGSTDFGRGHAPSSSVSSLRSQSSLDLRGLANMRRHGSQSSSLSMLSHSSSKTKYDPHVQAHVHKAPSVEEVSLGLRAYAGNPYAVAAQAEVEGDVHNPLSETGYGDDELGLDIRREDVATRTTGESDTALSGWKPYDSEAVGAGAFEPGSSAGTLRPSTQQPQIGNGKIRSMSEANARLGGGAVSVFARTHTNGYSGSRGGAGKDWGGAGGYVNRYENGHGYRNGGSGSDRSGDQKGAPGGGRRGRDDGRDDDEERRSRKPSVSSPSTSTSESESESESDTDDYGEQSPGIAQQPAAVSVPIIRAPPVPIHTHEDPTPPVFAQLRNGRKGVFRPPTSSTADNGEPNHPPTAEDDDVPLAQRIPSALKVQKSIRQQVRSERDQRRRERSVAPTPRSSRAPEGTVSPPPQYLPAPNQFERGRSLAARAPKSAPLGSGAGPLSSSQEAAMMAQRMLQPQHMRPVVRRQRAKTLSETVGSGVPADDLTKRLLKVQARDPDTPMPTHLVSPTHAHATSYVRDLASNERVSAASVSARRSPHSPQIGSQPFHMQQNPGDAPAPVRTLRPMRSFHGPTPAAADAASAPPVPTSLVRRPTSSKGRQPQETNAASDELMRNKSVKSARTSMDKNGRSSAEEAQTLLSHHPYAQVHPMLPVPSVSRGPSPPAPSSRHAVVQTRVYINDMQRFNVVEAGLETNAKDVLDMLRQQGDLRGEERRSSSWMLYEVCHDFGMERPVRNFELVTDISGSWNKEKTMNCFMAKQSPFALSLANIPSSIPTRSGYVDYESKRGRWNKRWLELREHGLWLSKREGKDDEFLCSLSAFDAYVVTRIHKSTKSFSFAVKSTDPITLFENKADYLHVFSVPEETGMTWIESIWLARSYILYQEKNVLFRNKNLGEGAGAGASLARSGTRKKPAQTYVSLAPPKAGAAQAAGPFEPGSLLAKRSAT